MSFSESYSRLCKELNIEGLENFAEHLGISLLEVERAQDQDVIPYSWYFILWSKYKFAPEWVRTGQGEKTVLTNFHRSNNSFYEIYTRLLEGLQIDSDWELACLLEMRISSLHEFLRQGYIPLDIYFKIYLLAGVNPNWVESGVGPKRLPIGAAV